MTQLALRGEAALEIVEPRRLTARCELVERVHDFCLLDFAICSLAAAATWSGVKPNFFKRSLIGADEPKVCMPILAPFAPTYRSQPMTEACSTETRAVASGGSTLLR